MKKDNKNISVVIPVYNSEKIIGTLVEILIDVLTDLCNSFEIILVNDSSSDNSSKIISKLNQDYEQVNFLELAKNYGQHNALLCGIRHAKYEIIVTLDDDLQNPPEKIPDLLNQLNKGYDVVYGAPIKLENGGILRNLTSIITKSLFLRYIMGVNEAKYVSPFRIFRTKIRESFKDYNLKFVTLDVLLTWGTNNFSHVYIEHEKRKIGKSNYNVRMLIQHALNMITGFTVLPLQLATILGLIFSIFGFSVLAFVVISYFYNDRNVEGFTFLASIISLFSGVQLLSMGIMGEYLARIYHAQIGKPQYIIKED